ncbi:hypothetical protein Y032_0884g2851 [Ancylostoma ceylanicum]|uniref:BACK domain-containing protein n=1 Tax=Ancylostoma ceylanicum TaxID=53326 RepID=A0A016WAF0_9BILA|nr:hypothetical protein Y032_0884g2851 [Ancylostoma ceylanicum]
MFLNHHVRRKHVAEDVSVQDLATLIHLAQTLGTTDLLVRISQCLARCAIQNDRNLCLCYVVSYASGLPIRKQLAGPICRKFDSIQSTLVEHIEDPEMLVPLLESCDLTVSSEKNLVRFIIDWSSFHHVDRERCLKLLNCTRKTFLSLEDLLELGAHAQQTNNDDICVAWAEYMGNPHSKICWDTSHIMDKMPRCGAGPHR